MQNTIIKPVLILLYPIIASVIPLRQALLILFILIIVNFISSVILGIRELNSTNTTITTKDGQEELKTTSIKLIDNVLTYTLLILTSAIVDSTIIYKHISNISLTQVVVIISGVVEIVKGFKLSTNLTGFSIIKLITRYLTQLYRIILNYVNYRK